MSDKRITSRPSSAENDEALRATSSLIMGRLISLFVHEANNHLATLSESAGLGDDIISAGNLSDKEKLKELQKLLASMDDRIGHAASLVRTLGSVGKHMEDPAAPIDINQAVEGIMPFLTKVARQKNLSLRTSLSSKLPAGVGDFFCLQCLILALFDNFCSVLAPSAAATIATDKTASSVVLNLSADCSAASDREKDPWPWNALEAFAAANGFALARQEQVGKVTVSIKRKE